jgi:hypothetical protein
MKKQLNVDLIQSELRGGSAFFPGYKASGSESPAPPTQTAVQTSKGVPQPVPRPVPRTVPRPDTLVRRVKRPMRQRQPFDIYEDQYARLKQIADSERGFVNGRGMSQMVREAIDDYLNRNAPPK